GRLDSVSPGRAVGAVALALALCDRAVAADLAAPRFARPAVLRAADRPTGAARESPGRRTTGGVGMPLFRAVHCAARRSPVVVARAVGTGGTGLSRRHDHCVGRERLGTQLRLCSFRDGPINLASAKRGRKLTVSTLLR